MYKKINPERTFVQMENEVKNFWNEKGIIEKNFKLNEGKEYFTFYDGPPTANGKPHVGHVLTRVIKDIIPRYWTMKGYMVPRKAGWDTHGLPVELEIEKKLGISGKDQIEEFGIENFIKECKSSVLTYAQMWKEMSDAIGFWVDMDQPYVTYHNTYIESEWWALKEMYKKNLLYEGFKVMPYCPRCETDYPPMRSPRAIRMSRIPAVLPSSRSRAQIISISWPGPPRPGRCPPTLPWWSTAGSITVRWKPAGKFISWRKPSCTRCLGILPTSILGPSRARNWREWNTTSSCPSMCRQKKPSMWSMPTMSL